ncbi:DUF4395 domain-containing protein [Blastococcus atacamensis]|uniref:DUF4395 domain-containing protein n=1 Tax=Blastococcus atacamensis TaxID=2070508 RepID=UPI000CEBC486|nr:DUF4395 domain-containing protein [Blastococcus atacamensis]
MGLFEFPNPVNETAARLVAGGVVTMSATTVLMDKPVLMVPLTYGFAARVLTGPTLSPLGQLVTRMVAPRLKQEPTLVPGPPKRLAQGMGLTMSGTALLLHYGFGRKRLAYGLVTALTAAAALEAFAGFCIACRLFPLLIKAGLVPEEACEQCANIWSRRPTAA